MKIVGMLLGLGGGMLVAGGVVALIVGLGIITRFAGISRTAQHNKLYESMILLGAVFGNLITVYEMPVALYRPGLILMGLFAGIYVGGWIMALAEVVQMFPIFSRRIGLPKNIGGIVIAIAAGKVLGSLVQFFYML
ncbi:MAG: stage V sporulation protein AB [Eubacteriales bacterium]|nr:stage V sporulation protein AB [Eubacteriales bacterium]